MKISFSLDLLDRDEVRTILDTSLEILRTVGAGFYHPRALEILHHAGAAVDFKTSVVRFEPSLVKETLKNVSSSVVMYGQDGNKQLDIGSTDMPYVIVGSYSKWVLDWKTGERRLATLRDLEDATIICDALRNIDIIYPPFTPFDVEPALVNVKTVEMLLKHSNKVVSPCYLNLESAGYINRMAQAVAGDWETLKKKPFILAEICMASPLKYSKVWVDLVHEAVKYGQPIMIESDPICGLNSPITVAGTVSQLLSEIIAGVVYTKLVDNNIPILGGLTVAALNQKEGSCVIGAPERILIDMMVGQVLDFIGLPSYHGYAATDSKIPTVQTGYEKAFGMFAGLLSHSDIIGIGDLDDCLTSNNEQLVIDSEMLEMLKRVLKGATVSRETLALDVIKDVGVGGNFLGHKHTRENYSREYWLPEIAFRGSWKTFQREGKETILKGAHRKVNEILQNYERKQLSGNVVRAIESVVKEAEEHSMMR